MKKYHHLLVCLVLCIVTIPQHGDTNPRPDFAVPARMTGVGSGSLDSTGNVVQNTNRVLNLLDQFQSITETLYGLQTPELYRLATGFRLVLDSLVESGSPIFQGLSNAARLSSGNITTVFDGIRQSINATIALNELHQAAINGTSLLLGTAGVQNISTVLDQLVRNVANLSVTLDEIEPALVEIQQLVRPSQALVDSRYPRDGIRKLNGILLDYVNIGRSTVPQINAIVNRIRMMDGFIARLASVTGGLRSYLNSTLATVNGTIYNGVQLLLQNALRTIRTNFNGTVTSTTRKLKQFFLDDLESVQLAARNASGLLVKRLTNVTELLDEVANNTTVVMEGHETEWVMNRTIAIVTELAWRMALSVTSSVPGADSCFAKFNYEYDKIPRLIYGSLVSCGQGEARSLQSVANALVGYLGVVQAQLTSEADQYNQCLSGLVPGSADALKLQRAVCLQGAEQLSAIWGDTVVDNQLQAFEELVREEVGYSATRHYQCVQTSDQLLLTEVRSLWRAIAGCFS
uniref:Putative 53.7 kDa salivary protein n=1 Tax=Anopheles stephensi TaxID=30069 RepID=Q8I6Q6_ANOST|nr:putative 53.7 kDa salivary protein [Anopheles stephensi]